MFWSRQWGRLWGLVTEIITVPSSSSSSSAQPARHVRIAFTEPERYVEGRTQGYLLGAIVVEAVDMAAEIFVFQRETGSLKSGPIDTFSNIASPADLEDYPVDDPLDGIFFRKDRADWVFRDLITLADHKQDIISDVGSLVASLNVMDDEVAEEIIIDGE